MARADLTPSRSRTLIAATRLLLAMATSLTPRLSGRLFGIDPAQNPASPYLARLYGARAALMAIDLLEAERHGAGANVARRHLAVDAVDVAASMAGARGGYLSRRAAWLTGATAMSLLVLGLRGSVSPPDRPKR